MINRFLPQLRLILVIPSVLIALSFSTGTVKAQSKVYTPIPLPTSNEISDNLSEKDIPLGDGGFARDYLVKFNAGDQVAIDVTSENFDSILTLLMTDGTKVGENDDGPDGSTNSLLFARIKESGEYIIRVRAFGEAASGPFTLKVTRLRPI